MTTLQHFRATLVKDDQSEATSIRIPFDVPTMFGSRARVPVRGTINGFPYRSSIFPYGGIHYLIVNKETREGARAKAGDEVEVVMERDDEPRVITPPPDLAEALAANPAAQAMWEKLSYTHQKEWAEAIEEAKKPETRARRIEKAVAELATGKRPRE
jgi:hypothetical protein